MLVAHPGGPFFQKRDEGWWSIPKGELEGNEDVFAAALREFQKETGKEAEGPFINLGSIKQKNLKQVYAWAFEGNWNDGRIPECNEITLEYPKGTGHMCTFPEIDKIEMLQWGVGHADYPSAAGTRRCPLSRPGLGGLRRYRVSAKQQSCILCR